MSFPLVLTQLREKHGLSRSDWAERSGVSRITLWRWEKGSALPREAELEAALASLNASREDHHTILRHWRTTRGSGIEPAPPATNLPLTHRGDLLVALRMRKGWTQTEAAEATRVPRVTLTKWENMVSWPQNERLHDLLFAYGATENELLALTSPWTEEGQPEDDLQTLRQKVLALDDREYQVDGLELLRLAGQLGLLTERAEAIPLLACVLLLLYQLSR